MQILPDKHRLCHDQGVNDGKALSLIIYVLLREDHALMNGKQAVIDHRPRALPVGYPKPKYAP